MSNKNKKIGFFITSTGWGGLEMNTLKLARLLTEKGFETQKQQQSVESRRKYLEGLKKDKEETTEISEDLG